MPGKKHLRGVGSKEQRQYEHIKESAEKSGRYGGRAEEVERFPIFAADRIENRAADNRVLLHDATFFGRQSRRLEQDLIGQH